MDFVQVFMYSLICIIPCQCQPTCNNDTEISASQLLTMIQGIQERLTTLEDYVKTVTYVNGTANLATSDKPAFQSSTWIWDGGIPLVAKYALVGVDKVLVCSHTRRDRNPWWSVDLQQRERVYRVEMGARGDSLSERLRNVYVGVTDIHPDIAAPNLYNFRVCAYSEPAFERGERRSFECAPEAVVGRFVIVQMAVDSEYLQLFAVKVFAQHPIKKP